MKDIKPKQIRIVTVAVICVILAVTAFFLVKILKTASPSDYLSNIISAIFTSVAGLLLTSVAGIVGERHMRALMERDSLEKIMHKMNSMAILWDTTFSYIRANDIFIKTTGYSEEELTDREILKKILPQDAFLPSLQAIINNKDEEFTITCKDGRKICTVWNTSFMAELEENHGHNRTTIMMSIGPDLTEDIRMRKELIAYSEKLKETERKFFLTTELSEIGLLLKENSSSLYYASERLCSMLGLVATGNYINGEDLREAIHPKHRHIFDTFASGRKTADESLSQDEIHSVDFRAIAADGLYHWYNFRYKATNTEGASGVGGAIMDITAEKEKDLIIEKMAYIDEVTQICNRNKFMLMGSELMQNNRNGQGSSYWIIVFDIDSFHIINDTCGYDNGNNILKEIAAVLTAYLTENGFTARIGGDNFAFVTKADNDDEPPVRLIKRIQSDISQVGEAGLEAQHITCSAGYCLMSATETCSFAEILERSEFALSLSDGTRNSIHRFDNNAHDAIIAGNQIEKDLIKAVDNNELTLYYQPKINLETGKVVGMEALIRWVKPDGTIVPPCDFIPVAENSLIITRISKFVLHEACRQNMEWQLMGLEPLTVSINLTAIDFYQTNVTENIRTALAETGLAPRWLDVELTESLALKDIDHAVSQMQEIKDLGVKISMDDFGTGYSSLSYIQILPISLLKLDRSFIMYLEEDEISREIVSAVIRIAKSKKIETIAEGIETPGQAEILKATGCDHAQGYFFGKPMPAQQFEQFIRSRQTSAV